MCAAFGPFAGPQPSVSDSLAPVTPPPGFSDSPAPELEVDVPAPQPAVQG